MNQTVNHIHQAQAVDTGQAWKPYQYVIFRIAFVFFILLALPLHWEYYAQLTSFHISRFQDWFQLTRYYPQFLPGSAIGTWGISSYANWGVALLIALVVAAAWTYFERSRRLYNDLYYFLRVLLRYRLAIGVIGYGVIKLFPLQFPEPALSDLHTAYGDFLPWKIYYHTTGVGKAYYQQTIGLLEIVGGLFLLFRRTATVGAIILILLLANIVVANFAYQLGDHVYASYLLLIALAILWYDTPRLYSLVVKNRFTVAALYNAFNGGRKYKQVRNSLRGALLLFIVGFVTVSFYTKTNAHWPYPYQEGLAGTAGYYNVKEYAINGKSLPYSLIDSVRWQNVVFEKWNTISVKTAIVKNIDLSRPSVQSDPLFDYQVQGNGGRNYYSYTVDSVAHTLSLATLQGPEAQLQFHYQRPDNNTVILSTVTNQRDSVRIVLQREPRSQLLLEGRRNTKKKF